MTPAALPTEPSDTLAEWERRHLTVLFCDVVNSTRMAAELDPEDWRDALAAFQQAATAAVEQQGGYVAQYSGDGIVVYFGYPHAFEDNVSRGVRAGLRIVDTARTWTAGASAGVSFAVRIGIHIGLTVVGLVGDAERHEPTALGHTTNMAARLRTVAPQNGVVVSESVRRLTAGEFATEDLGLIELRGLGPTRAHLVLGATGIRSRLAASEHLTPFTGRRGELAILLDRWRDARDGGGAAVCVTGEAGIGKSRLALALRNELASEPHTWLECRGLPYTANSAFAPIIELLRQGLGFSETDKAAEKLAKLQQRVEATTLPTVEATQVLGQLLGLQVETSSAIPARPPDELRARLIEIVVEWVLILGRQQPVLLLIEDLHWCDPSTIEVLGHLIERIPTARTFMLLTSRPEFEIPWPLHPPLSVLALPRLSRDDVNGMLGHLCVQAALPGETVSQLISRADGIPLFVEELAHMVMEVDESSGPSTEEASRTIPETLQDSLMARLDRLGDAKAVAQIAAVIGREFSVPLLERISDREPLAIRNCLNKLRHAGVVFSPSADGSCLFKHALLRDAAYHSLLKSVRRRCHLRIADELIRTFPDLAERQPEVLARHYTEADRPADAIEYWRRAGRQALACFANQEAVTYAQQGLALIKNLEETPNRLQLELELQLALGPPLMANRGYADPLVAQAYGRARELAGQLGDPPALYPVLFGLWTYHCVSARHLDAARIAMELTELAKKAEQPGLMLEADVAAGITHFYRGEFRDARQRLARVDQFYDAVRDADHAFVFGQDPRAAARAHLMLVEWTLGDFAAAEATERNAVALAEELTHPFSVSYLLAFAAWLQHVRGDFEACHRLATRGIEVSRARALTVFLAFSEILHGSALLNLGQHDDGLDRLEAGMSRFRATASELILPFWSAIRAQAYAAVGRAAEGLEAVNEALAVVQRTGERHAEAELHRIRGELLSMTGGTDDAIEAAFRQALDTAVAQDARGWALRAATSQYRHLSAQGRVGEARSILAAARDQLRDSGDEPDIQKADLLLAAAN